MQMPASMLSAMSSSDASTSSWPNLTFESRVRLAVEQAPDGAHHLVGQLLRGPGAVALDDAVLHVLVEQAERHLVECGLDRADLRQHVDAVAVVIDHLLDAPGLALDALEAGEDLGLGG